MTPVAQLANAREYVTTGEEFLAAGPIAPSNMLKMRLNALALVLGDLISILFGFAIAYVTATIANHLVIGRPFLLLDADILLSRGLQVGGLAVGLLFWLLHRGHYTERMPFWIETRQVVLACGLVLLIDGFMQFALKDEFSRLWLVQGWLFAVIGILIARLVIKNLLMKAGCWIIPTIVLGRGKNARDVVRALQSEPRLGYRVIGVCDFSGVCEINAAEHPEDTTDPAKGEFVVIALDTSDIVQYEALAKGLSRRKVPFAFIPPIRGMSLIGLQTHYFFSHDVMLMLERNTLGQPFSHLAKRLFDIFFSSALILVLLPFVLVLALIIKRDGGPVFYRCTRVGYGGRHFDCLKFRSMVVDAKEKLEIHLKDNPAAAEEYGQFCKLRDDPRITAIGAFLRRTSLDEAPQLFNVLKGEMSLVGPRPAMPHELYRFGDLVDEYCEVKPGITGVWQVSGRNDVNFEDRVRFDTWYVVNWSFWHDIAILLKTIPVVFRRTGAY